MVERLVQGRIELPSGLCRVEFGFRRGWAADGKGWITPGTRAVASGMAGCIRGSRLGEDVNRWEGMAAADG